MNALASEGGVHVVVVGGGLAGLAVAVALSTAGCRVELFEARRHLGGRAGSFRDPASGELIDHCQHVSMGCCTNLADFCRRTQISDCFRRDRVLNFIGPDGRPIEFKASPWLPAPLHLALAFWRLKYLSAADRLRIARAMWKLMRMRPDEAPQTTIGHWLRHGGQSATAIERFWNAVFVSALGEDLDRASLAAARKVVVDGFLAAREAYVLEVPTVPLGTLYDQRLGRWLADHNVAVHLNSPVRQVSYDGRPRIQTADDRVITPAYVVLAVPWSKLAELVSADIAARWTWLGEMAGVESAPITGVHLWFDRPIMTLEHAVLVGRLSQWIFRHPRVPTESGSVHYYQVVISASRQLTGRQREQVVREVCDELAAIWPETAAARLLRSRVVTEHGAVFSAHPGLDRLRPRQQTSIPGLLVVGDWTDTSWPATMESAVRSGYLAAEAILQSCDKPERFAVPDLPRGPLARWLIRE